MGVAEVSEHDVIKTASVKNGNLDRLSVMLTSLFYQIDSEEEFVAAVSNDVANPDVARLLYRSMGHVYKTESNR